MDTTTTHNKPSSDIEHKSLPAERAPTSLDQDDVQRNTPDNQQSNSEPESLTDVLDAIDEQIDGKDEISIDDILDAFGTRAFGPLLVAPAIIVLSPLGAIPGVPAVFGAVIILIAGQHLFGLDNVWIPGFLRRRSFSAEKWKNGREKINPFVRWVDRILKRRLRVLTKPPADRVLALLICVAAILMVPLELVPFAVMLPAGAVLILALAILARDGYLAILGSVIVAGSGYLTWISAF